jgi:polyisoprenoid-binding protein YceI
VIDNTDGPGALDVQAILRDGQGRWVLDAAGSAVEFHVKHFWGAITVHGHFEQIDGEGVVAPDGTITGHLDVEAGSLTTKNRRRDQHLRSADFFDVAKYPRVVVSVEHLVPAGPATTRGRIALEAAGKREHFDATVDVVAATVGAVTLRCELVVDRTVYGMTWSPLGMAASGARAVVKARFIRQ